MIREILKKLKINLPMFPKIFEKNPLKKVFNNLRYKPLGLYLGLSIGVIAKKI